MYNVGIPKIQIPTNTLYNLYFMNADISVFHEQLEHIKTNTRKMFFLFLVKLFILKITKNKQMSNSLIYSNQKLRQLVNNQYTKYEKCLE